MPRSKDLPTHPDLVYFFFAFTGNYRFDSVSTTGRWYSIPVSVGSFARAWPLHDLRTGKDGYGGSALAFWRFRAILYEEETQAYGLAAVH